MAVRLQKIIVLMLMMGFACLLQAQSKSKPKFKFPSQAGKHTLSFYPIHFSYYIGSYSGSPYSPIPAIGYQYHFKNRWSAQAKMFYRQLENPIFGTSQSSVEEKNIKLGIQYYSVNGKFQLLLGAFTYLENQISKSLSRNGEMNRVDVSRRNEAGLEFGLGFGLRINEQARLTLGIALRFGKINEIGPGNTILFSDNSVLATPVESLGFAYTF